MATNDKQTNDTKASEPVVVHEHAAHQHHHGAAHHISRPAGIIIVVATVVTLLLIGMTAGFVVSRGLNQVGRFHMSSYDDRPSGMYSDDRMMGNGAYGKVTVVSDSSITLTDDRSGGSLTYKIDSNTDVNNKAGDNAKVGDIKVGDTVRVRATSNISDNTADTIDINPAATPRNLR